MCVCACAPVYTLRYVSKIMDPLYLLQRGKTFSYNALSFQTFTALAMHFHQWKNSSLHIPVKIKEFAHCNIPWISSIQWESMKRFEKSDSLISSKFAMNLYVYMHFKLHFYLQGLIGSNGRENKSCLRVIIPEFTSLNDFIKFSNLLPELVSRWKFTPWIDCLYLSELLSDKIQRFVLMGLL